MSKEKDSRYCKDIENIENYDAAKADDFKGWCIHHRRQTHLPNGERRDVRITEDELKTLDMYYNRPADELIFMKTSEHNSLHHKGKTSPNKGKKFSEEHRNKMAESKRGRHWYHNDKGNKFCYECPPGYEPGYLMKKALVKGE